MKTYKIIRFLLFYAAALLIIAVILTIFWPLAIRLYAAYAGRLMPVENSVRWSALAVVFLGALACLGFAVYRGLKSFKLLAAAVFFGIIILLPIAIFDIHSITQEESWIRYPTAVFLFLAGLALMLISRKYNLGEKWPKPKEWIWMLLGLGLWFAAADEILQIHEKFGAFMENAFRLPHIFSDLVTVGYGLIGLIAVGLFLRLKHKGEIQAGGYFGNMYLFGFLLFMTAAFFDTADFAVHKILLMFGQWLSAHAPSLQSAFFTFWYDPKLLLNAVEEVFEFEAALFFFLGGAAALWNKQFVPKEVSGKVRQTVMAVAVLILAGLILPVWFVPNLMTSNSPFFDNYPAKKILSAKDGLLHADGLAYDRAVGLVIANESQPKRVGKLNGPGVFIYKDGKISRLPDPDNFLTDTDSVSINQGKIYASDGASGEIYVFNEDKKSFRRFVGKEEGVIEPEAMEWQSGQLYAVNEKQKAIMRVGKGFDSFQHPLWVSPEEIRFVPKLNGFLVTDDVSGTIFLYRGPDKPLEVWAGKEQGLQNPESLALLNQDTILVTDNGRGEIIFFSLDGKVKRRYLLKFAFRDLQGIAANEKGEVFFVTADGYDSRSPISSAVWQFVPN